ncbi:MAG: GNAT family N-acetyltransferase [Deltaproteobacteria bacterium]|nr:MAG: GNAT family N-acetyltransferase [Deltaproteobacteria bacterium]
MQASYRNPDERTGIYEVLEAAFPSIVSRIELARELGWEWEGTTTPFVSEVDGDVVAHVGVLETTLLVQGQRINIAGVHAVGCRPEFRKQGHMRTAMNDALAYVDSKNLPALLTCSVPAIYASFGFQPVQEHKAWFDKRSTPAAPKLQPLSTNSTHLQQLHQALLERAPISESWCVRDEGWLFGICEVFAAKGLGWIGTNNEMDLFVVSQIRDNVLHLYDVVAPEIPPLDEVIAKVPGTFAQVCVHFPTDRWEPPTRWELMPEDDVLMVRGNLPLPEIRCLPPTARW